MHDLGRGVTLAAATLAAFVSELLPHKHISQVLQAVISQVTPTIRAPVLFLQANTITATYLVAPSDSRLRQTGASKVKSPIERTILTSSPSRMMAASVLLRAWVL